MVQPEDDDKDPMPRGSMAQLFDKVVARISTSSSSSPTTRGKSIDTDSKLRLYGLYKFIQEGNCPGGASLFQPTAVAKQRAWQACQGMDTTQAQLEYVRLAASLDPVCQDLLDEYEQQPPQPQDSVEKKKDTDNGNNKEEPEGSVPSTQEEGPTQESCPAKQQQETFGIDWLWSMLRLVALWILPRPIVPRGGLDLAWADLGFAVVACLRSWCWYNAATKRHLEQEALRDVQGLWQRKAPSHTTREEEDHHVVVGYSVRSLLDLYLLHHNFPPQAGQEVIVVPPINIPGMVQILVHYGLVVVPVDTSSSSPSRMVDLQAIQQAITERTVAILVVHPFGNASLSRQDFARLRAMADQHQIQVWEDAAESFRGLPNNNNNDNDDEASDSGHADITFYSFGLIKTATALGGGIAILRGSQAAEAAAAMRRLQHHHYPQQTTWEYAFHKVWKAAVANLFSSSPALYGVLVYICLQWGGYDFFDRIVTRNLRSIAPPTNGQTTTNGWMPSIRKRPSLPLLQVLRRRLTQSPQTKRTVECRIQQCNGMTVSLQHHASALLAATGESSTNALATHWLYPIQVDAEKKKPIQRYLLAKGWDIAAGTSQLQCVQPTVPFQHPAPLYTQSFMAKILYLPVANRRITRQQSMELARLLQEATTIDMANANSSDRSTDNGLRITSFIIPVLLLVFWSGGGIIQSIRLLLIGIILPTVLRLLCLGFVMALFLAYTVQWLGGSLYLESSSGVARYSSMLDPMSDEGDGASDDARVLQQSTAQREENEPPPARSHSNVGVVPSLRCLEVPTARQLPGDFLGCVILTGATGFVGSLVLRDLLWHRKALNVTAGVFVICRKKRSHSAKERIDRLLEQDMFSFLSGQEKRELIHVLEGDLTEPDAGLSAHDMKQLLLLPTQHKVVTRVIHSAASVSFTQELVDAARSNIISALNMQNLTRQLAQAQKQSEDSMNLPQPQFVHLSTAFVHGSMCGTQTDPLPERLFPLDPYEPAKLYESMLGTQFYASKAMRDLGFHNTYAFTKCVCEHMLVQQSNTALAPVDTLIVRPSIVGPSLESPTEGWAGLKPSTIVAAGCLYWSYQWNLWSFGSYDVPCIPVDVLSRFVLRKAFDEGMPEEANEDKPEIGCADATVSEDSFEQVSSCGSVQSLSRCSSNSQGTRVGDATSCQTYRIYNAAWDSSSAACAMFTWLDYCGATLQVGSIMGYFNRSTAYVGLWITSRLLPHLGLTPDKYEVLHTYLVQTPAQIILGLCCRFGWKELELKLLKLSGFLDLPLLFYPYMNNTFYFQSSLLAPETMDGTRYVFSCIVAAHRFFTKQSSSSRRVKEGDEQHRPMKFFLIGGQQHQQSSSILWAFTQPLGGPIIRITGWLFAAILRATCHSLSVDVPSFEAALQMKIDAAKKHESGSKDIQLVLAPTHRSFFDFIILSYLTFALPELRIAMPKIAAANDFEDLPVIGWLSEVLGAFYLRRGRGRADPELNAKVMTMKQQGTSVFEVFLEGSRSRDRRFLEPRTGLLRSFSDCGGCQVIVPITISYEKLPEQHILAVEAADHCRRRALNNGGLLMWLLDALRGRVNLGSIHVAAGRPSVLDCKSSSDYKQLAHKVQHEQQLMLCSSDYHVRATATLLNLDPTVVRSALIRLGCRFMPSAPSVTLPEDVSEMCTVMLHLSPALAKVCPGPEWRKWLNHTCDTHVYDVLNLGPEVAALSRALSSVLAAADDRVDKANEHLVSKGFHRPNLKHLQQAAQNGCSDVDVPIILINAAATLFLSKSTIGELSLGTSREDVSTSGAAIFNSYPPPPLESEECLGFWGFRDSGFSLQVSKKGSHVVVMAGQRYSVSGRPLLKLLPFVEAETGMKIDPFNETFKVTQKSLDKKTSTEIAFTEKDLALLQSTVQKISLSLPDRIRHGTGHSQQDVCAIRDETANNLRVPDAVVWPNSEDEVEALIALAIEKRWCLIPFGGGTNVTQATRCPPKEIEPRSILSVDMTKLNRLQWLNEEDGLACFEAGINGRELIAVLERRGYTMGHEPDSIEFSTLGGWIATKASGMKRNKYGNIEDIVRGVRVACSSGRISQGGMSQNGTNENPVFGRASCGLDFLPMILGSEGCLGIITSAVVKVWPLPETKEYESVLFMSFDCGLGFVRDIAKLDRMIPASVRLLDNEHFRLGQALSGEPSSAKERILGLMQSFIAAGRVGSLDPKSVACATVCYEGKKSEVQLQQAELKRVAKDHGGILLGAGVGKAGYDMTFLIAYLRDFAMTYHFLGESFETFAPWSKVGRVIEKTKRRLNIEHETRCLPGKPFVGCRVTQLYQDGVCLYFYFCMNTENVKDASHVFSEIEHAARCEILKQGGNLSHHHGIGKVRAAFLRTSVTPTYKRIVESVKESMDPQNIFAAANGLFGI